MCMSTYLGSGVVGVPEKKAVSVRCVCVTGRVEYWGGTLDERM